MPEEWDLRRDAANRGIRVLVWGMTFDVILVTSGLIHLWVFGMTEFQKHLLGHLILLSMIKTLWTASIAYLARRFWL